MKRVPLYLLTLSALCLCIAISCKPKTHPESERIIKEIKKLAAEANVPHIQVEYGDGNGVLSFESSQVDTIEASAEGETVFQSASLSKPVFGYIVMKMVDNGEIDLDEPIYKYTNIDRFENKEWAKMITPRMVLSHKTGLYDWATRSPTDADWPTSTLYFKFRPDSAFSYSGEAFFFLQQAVENIRGESLQQIAEKEVFIPFNMPSTSYGWRESYNTLAAEGHLKGNSTGREIFPSENAAFTLRTTAKEYSNFVKGAIMEGKGLKPETHKQMLTPQDMAYVGVKDAYGKQLHVGLSVAIEQNEELGTIYYHSGSNGDFIAYFISIPKEKRYLTYLSNSDTGSLIINDIISLCFGNTEPLHCRRR